MGVEYRHYLLPSDAGFIPAKEVFKKIDAVLAKWKLRKGLPAIYDLTDGNNSAINESLDALQPGHGIALQYEGIEGMPVALVMGESYYKNEVTEEDRYFQNIHFVAGSDYRIHNSWEGMAVSVITPPEEDSVALKPYCETDDQLFLHAEAYTGSAAAIPPEVDIWVANRDSTIGEQHFPGYWRTALIFDCGKDLPKVFDTLYMIPNAAFVADIEEALGCHVIQIGEFY